MGSLKEVIYSFSVNLQFKIKLSYKELEEKKGNICVFSTIPYIDYM